MQIKGAMIRCVRCEGRKTIFKVNGAYSHINTGGVAIQCPMCLGNGFTKSLEEAIESIKKENEKNKADKIKGKDFKDGKNARESNKKA